MLAYQGAEKKPIQEPDHDGPRQALIYTIGHSNHPIERFIGLLQAASIETLVDVRSHPGSRFNPHFNQAVLASALVAKGIAYRWLGEALGGKPKDRALCGPYGRPDYAKMASTPVFRAGIDALIAMVEASSSAMMCAEEDPARCHRSLLVAPVLSARGIAIRHIRGDGETSDLVAPEPTRQQDLFG